MFHDHPETRALFARVQGDNTYSPEFEAHSQRILGALDNCISLLDEPPTLAAELEHLKAQHADRGVKAEYYDVSLGFSYAITVRGAGSITNLVETTGWGPGDVIPPGNPAAEPVTIALTIAFLW